jgi:hypothetical protein
MSEAAPVAPQQQQSTTSLAEWGLLFLAPGLSYWLMHFHPIMQRGYLDPYIYTGYIHNFVDLFERYGTTYYGVRFGTIVPGQIATAVFGPIGGYFALRYLLALTAAVPFYLLVRQQHGRPAAVALFSLLVTSPFLARTLLWDYTDSTGVPFVFASICLYAIGYRRRLLADACAGALAGLAIHSNVFALMPLSVFFGAHLALSIGYRREPSAVVPRLLVISITVVLVSVVGALYYWWRVRQLDIFSITATTSVWLTGGAIADWRTAGTAWVAEQWSVLTPAILAILVPFVRSHRGLTFHDLLLWSSGAAVTLFYYVYQFLLDGTILQLFYYFSYLLPFVFMLLSLVVSAVMNSVGERTRALVAAAVMTSGIVPWVLYSYELANLRGLELAHYFVIVAVAGVLVVAAVHVSRFRTALAVCAAVALGVMLVGSFAGSSSIYAGTLNSRRHPAALEMDVYRVALRFIENVPRMRERPGMVRFWYSNLPAGNSMQSVQSTYLWGRSKVQREGAGLPELTDADLQLLRNPQLEWLTLLAEKQEQLAEGRAALLQAGIRHTNIARRILTHGAYTLHIELLELEKP